MGDMPEDAPFEVRNSRRRMTIQLGAGAVVVVMGLLMISFTALFGVVVAASGLGIAVLSILSLRITGPLMAADSTGVWVQAFEGPKGVRHFPWEGLDSLYVKEVSRRPPFRMLCVLPQDLETLMAAEPQHEATMRKSVKLVGAPYSVNLVAASMADEDALGPLERLAAGRATIRR